MTHGEHEMRDRLKKLSPPAEPKVLLVGHGSNPLAEAMQKVIKLNDRPPTTEPAESVVMCPDCGHQTHGPVCGGLRDTCPCKTNDELPTAPPAEDAKALKPCPFCGSEAQLYQAKKSELFAKQEWFVRCTHQGVCFGRVPSLDLGFAFQKDAIEVWNRRDSAEIERQTPAVERDRDNWKFKAQLLVKQLAKVHNVDDCLDTDCDSCAYIAEITGELGDWSVDAIIERFVEEVEKEVNALAPYRRLNEVYREAMQTVKARRSVGEGK